MSDPRCCDLHNRVCEPPSELCCERCTEAAHPDHADGSACIAPDLRNPAWHPAIARAGLARPRLTEALTHDANLRAYARQMSTFLHALEAARAEPWQLDWLVAALMPTHRELTEIERAHEITRFLLERGPTLGPPVLYVDVDREDT